LPSAVEAVRCATEIQAASRTRDEHLPEEQRMWFRIGINLGDVIVRCGDLPGDVVNIATSIQTIAEPAASPDSKDLDRNDQQPRNREQ
jgi:adenylate cyclase